MKEKRDRIVTIIDPQYKTGYSAKTKSDWVMMRVATETEPQATVFAPAKVGDEVLMTYNDQYDTWNAKVVRPDKNSELLEAMRKLYELNLAIYKAITAEAYPEPSPGPQTGLESARAVAERIRPRPDGQQPLLAEDYPDDGDPGPGFETYPVERR